MHVVLKDLVTSPMLSPRYLIYIDYIVKQFVPDILEIYTVLSILFVTYVCVVDQDL